MLRRNVAAALLAAVLALPVAAAPVVIAPPESGKADAALNAVVNTLVTAAEAQDFAPFEAVLTPEATASFGGDYGPEGFKRAYGIGGLAHPSGRNF